jgi:hypothetical protein
MLSSVGRERISFSMHRISSAVESRACFARAMTCFSFSVRWSWRKSFLAEENGTWFTSVSFRKDRTLRKLEPSVGMMYMEESRS